MLTLPTFTEPVYSEANSAITGAIIRQGPHQGAQKSTSTGSWDCKTSCWKFESVNSATLAMISLLP